ncbi:hypothetical protein K402DRAFT_343531 [Aulographum hederae CBS 113979]|uniref:Meiotically up-regulated gene 190 protein n=1 Tax=Aulographum hederae CBS 113979 TaxID=1176131 RepID=A0A6G1GJ83_9PEZI|nr:hypothetical protein K402DRAFT_343531 [Aulographum hederae CBS 113979]
MSGVEDSEAKERRYKAPYSPRNPIPTISHYREIKEQRRQDANVEENEEPSKRQQALDSYKSYRNKDESDPDSHQQASDGAGSDDERSNKAPRNEDEEDVAEDTTQQIAESDPKKRRKEIKKSSGNRAEREVTDPITHLPIKIRDFTGADLKDAPQNEPQAGSTPRTATGLSNRSKDEEQLRNEAVEGQRTHAGMEAVFPPPRFDAARAELVKIHQTAVMMGVGFLLGVFLLLFLLEGAFGIASKIEGFIVRRPSSGKVLWSVILLAVGGGLGYPVVWALQDWTEKKVRETWEEEVWEAGRQDERRRANAATPESTLWLNSFLASVWPLVNPDLFIGLADTLEDVMQASLPKLVRNVSVEDLGQGSEALRILGITWLPTGAAARSVKEDGKLENDDARKGQGDRAVPGEGEVKQESKDGEEDTSVAEGMEAEEGDFVNLEIGFSYRARPEKKRMSMKSRSKNAHLFLAFYLPGGLKFPVWVELRGIVGTMRLRLQLTPDPPFFALCTLTFLGQPKVDASCVPLTKRGLNLMDVPVISSFVQSSIDAAMAEYVAPKSLTLNLQDMLVGDDFKRDTTGRGVLVIRIKRAFDFKEGDMNLGPLRKGSTDGYVSVAWAKFGKTLWSTRVIEADMEPAWEETAYLLVTPQEIDAQERLRIQLWDSDRLSADDDLGRIELPLKQLMRDQESNGKMCQKVDGFRALEVGKGMPGKLEYEVGYYGKTRVLESQVVGHMEDPSIKTAKDLEDRVAAESERKLRETSHNEADEVEQQKKEDIKDQQDQIIIDTPPPQEYPSGILSIQIHQITGLELETPSKSQATKNEDASDEEEEGDDLPSAYCTLILNHSKVFQTRTKPKNGKPYYNAGVERFIRDWRSTEVHLSVRDSRVHEDDALIGVVYLPLKNVFATRAQSNDFYPLAGGVGFGRVRISMVFRSVQLQVPRNMLGWDIGTLEVHPEIRTIDLPKDIWNLRLKLRTSLAYGKYHPGEDGWKAKRGRAVNLAFRRRYSSPLVLEFYHSSLIDKTSAFAVLWLKDISDDEEQTITLPVWKGDLKRAEACCLDEYGEKQGSVELKLKVWPGLSQFHSSLAKHDSNIKDVMEVLDTTNDSSEAKEATSGAEGGGSSSSSSSSDSSSDNEEDSELQHDGHRGPIDQIKEYNANKKQLHRRERGYMQWKVPRTLHWVKGKAERAEKKATSLFKHHESGGGGIETEV